MFITERLWGRHQGKDVFLVRLINSYGNFVELTNYGATIVSICVPDSSGRKDHVVLGYPDLSGYLQDTAYMGSTIGRFANRIKEARFILADHEYLLEANDGENTNHGGISGYHQQVFDKETKDGNVMMSLTDLAGTGGYPGKLDLKVTYTWTDDNELAITYEATTDAITIANFTNHTYFNLSGEGNVLSHSLQINTEAYLENNDKYLPTGRMLNDTGQFSKGRILNNLIDQNKPIETGLNRYFIFSKDTQQPQVTLYSPASGRVLQVSASYPGITVYTGQYLDTAPGHNGAGYKAVQGIALECQHYPDSIHHPHFPQAVLKPDEPYREFIKFKFTTR